MPSGIGGSSKKTMIDQQPLSSEDRIGHCCGCCYSIHPTFSSSMSTEESNSKVRVECLGGFVGAGLPRLEKDPTSTTSLYPFTHHSAPPRTFSRASSVAQFGSSSIRGLSTEAFSPVSMDTSILPWSRQRSTSMDSSRPSTGIVSCGATMVRVGRVGSGVILLLLSPCMYLSCSVLFISPQPKR